MDTPCVTEPTTPANRLRETVRAERPQERLQRLGAAVLSDTELLAMLLRSGTRGHDVMTVAARLVAGAGSLAGLVPWREADFRRIRGIGRVKGLQLVAVLELARRLLLQQTGETPQLNRPDLMVAHLQPLARGLQVEKFWVLCVNRKLRLLRRIEISSGTATAALVHPREVFREAVREAATGVICAHNHPSGDPAPSQADFQATRQLSEAGRALDIELIDHLIIGQPAHDPAGLGYFSFRASGLL